MILGSMIQMTREPLGPVHESFKPMPGIKDSTLVIKKIRFKRMIRSRINCTANNIRRLLYVRKSEIIIILHKDIYANNDTLNFIEHIQVLRGGKFPPLDMPPL